MGKTPKISGKAQLTAWLASDPIPTQFVYVIKAQGDSPIKVGKAENVMTRLAQLQTGNPRKLDLLHVLVGYSELEWQLHRRLRRCRVQGEWFDGEPITRFLEFVEDLSSRMSASYADTGIIPHWRDFGNWETPRKREGAPVTTRFVPPAPPPINESVVRATKAVEAWMDDCPDCGADLQVGSEPGTYDPAWEAGTVSCLGGHCWLFTTAKWQQAKRPTSYYITNPA